MRKELELYIKENGGATTYNGEIVELKTGYVVATSNNVLEDGVSWEEYTDYQTGYVGYWLDPETNELYIDDIRIVDDYEIAMAMARKYNQKAIYNFETGKSIDTEKLNKTFYMLKFNDQIGYVSSVYKGEIAGCGLYYKALQFNNLETAHAIQLQSDKDVSIYKTEVL